MKPCLSCTKSLPLNLHMVVVSSSVALGIHSNFHNLVPSHGFCLVQPLYLAVPFPTLLQIFMKSSTSTSQNLSLISRSPWMESFGCCSMLNGNVHLTTI